MISSGAQKSFNSGEHQHQPIENDAASEDDYFPDSIEDIDCEPKHETVKLEPEDDSLSEDGSYYNAVEENLTMRLKMRRC